MLRSKLKRLDWHKQSHTKKGVTHLAKWRYLTIKLQINLTKDFKMLKYILNV